MSKAPRRPTAKELGAPEHIALPTKEETEVVARQIEGFFFYKTLRRTISKALYKSTTCSAEYLGYISFHFLESF